MEYLKLMVSKIYSFFDFDENLFYYTTGVSFYIAWYSNDIITIYRSDSFLRSYSTTLEFFVSGNLIS